MNNSVQLPKPKLVTTSPQIYKDRQTFLAITKPSTQPSRHFNNVYINCLPANFNSEYLLILTNDLDETKGPISNALLDPPPRLLLTTNTIYDNRNLSSKIPTIYLDTIEHHFQFFSEPWNKTSEDALAIMAIVNQVNRIQTDYQLNIDNIAPGRRALLKQFSIKLETPPQSVDEEFWLFTQYYVPKQKERYQEIIQTLELNIANPLIDKIVLFIEDSKQHEHLEQKYSSPAIKAKIICVPIDKRLAYSDFLKYVASTEVPPNTIVALANSDIYFDNSLLNLWKISLDDRCLALLRYEHSPEGTAHARIFGPRADSQDTWILNSNSIKSRAATKWTDETYTQFNYLLGTPGCDNSFTTDMVKERFVVVNPAGSIKSYHIHSSKIRSYTSKDLVYRPLYFSITPTMLLEKNIVKAFSMKPLIEVPYSSTIQLKSNVDARVTTYVTMLARGNRYKWAPPPAANGYKTSLKIYKFEGHNYVSHQGVIFNQNKIYLGNSPQEQVFLGPDFFNGLYLNTYGQYFRTSKFLAIPVRSPDIFRNKYTFVTQYVIPLMRCIYELYKAGHTDKLTVFWSNDFMDIASKLNFCIPLEILPWSNNINVYSEEIYTIPGGYSEPSQENIDCFRATLASAPSSSAAESSNHLLYLASNQVLSVDFGERLAVKIKKYGWEMDIYDGNNPPSHAAFENKCGVIFWGEPDTPNRWNKLWALPKGAAMLEFQNEFKLDGEAQVMGAACGLDTRIFILQKADASYLQNLMEEYIIEYLQSRTMIPPQLRQAGDL